MVHRPEGLKLEPILYAGSVKNVRTFGGAESDELLFEFTDRYSVFDWGAMPQTIPQKGKALAVIGAVLLERLEDPVAWQKFFAKRGAPIGDLLAEELAALGLSTHYRGLLSQEGDRLQTWKELNAPPAGMIVWKTEVHPPEAVKSESRTEYRYAPVPSMRLKPRLVPLEVVFRHRLTEGSSILERRPDLKPGHVFSEPLIEFFTKLEPRDRHLTEEEALKISGLEPEALKRLEKLNQWTSLILKDWLAEENLELIDGKFEWALLPSGKFMLVDSIGPDELRIETRDGTEISKEVFRRFYRNTEWYEELKAVKARLDSAGVTLQDWQADVKSEPPPAPERILNAFAGALQSMSARLAKRDFFGSPRLEKLAQEMRAGPERLRNGRVLLLGSGGREHALAWKILQSDQVQELLWYPGNVVAAEMLQKESQKGIRILTPGTSTAEALAEASLQEKVDLTVVGPDQYLADGWVDVFERQGLRIFGPTRSAARLEWSKSFSKDVLRAAGVPTAESFTVTDENGLARQLENLDWSRRWVVKADGLALGKGVKVCETRSEAQEFGASWLKQGQPLIVEEFLQGRELSWFAFCDGETCRLLEPARDYKTLLDGGKGPNTGGMGAISPVPEIDTSRWEKKLREGVFLPVLEEMRKRGSPYRGLLYAGLMVSGDRTWVLEFNARFGDPETQVLLPRMKDDLVPWLVASADQRLCEMPRKVGFDPKAGAYVVMAAPGYPEKPITGAPIEGLKSSGTPRVFLAGVTRKNGQVVTSGGRVLGVLGLGDSHFEATSRAYNGLNAIRFADAHFRRDVGQERRARIVVMASGRGSNFDALCRETAQAAFPGEIVALVSNRNQAPCLAVAAKHGIPARVTTGENELLETLQSLRPDLIVLAGYMKLLPKRVIDAFRTSQGRSGVINIHPSLLPELPGLHSYRRAFEERRPVTGVTVHEVEEEMDSGPILAQESFSIADCRSAEEVEQLGLRIEHRLYPKAIRKWILENWNAPAGEESC